MSRLNIILTEFVSGRSPTLPEFQPNIRLIKITLCDTLSRNLSKAELKTVIIKELQLVNTNRIMSRTEVISAKDPESASRAASVLNKGGVIVYPTETLYGIGALASRSDAIGRIFEIKGRPHGKPIPLLVKNMEMLSQIADTGKLVSALSKEFWPGRLTLILKQTSTLPELITCGTGKIALRISSHPFLQTLFDIIDEPLTSTSANLSGDQNLLDSRELFDAFNGKVDLVVDSGKIPESRGSTIVDLTLDPPQFLREGDIKTDTLKEFIDGSS